MNLGRRRLTNATLVAAFRDLGFDQVAPFLASGNVVFKTKKQAIEKLTKKLESGLEAALRYPVPTFLRSADDVQRIATHEPFDEAMLAPSTRNVQVMLLQMTPSPKARRHVLSLETQDDHLAFGERELYWLPLGNMSASELDLKSIEKAVGPTTTRAQRTLVRLAAKFLGPTLVH
jgi:uncharacterized protein (DUF1697 family)